MACRRQFTRLFPLYCILSFAVLLAFVQASLAAENIQVSVQWADNSTSPDLAGYRLYAGGVPVCISNSAEIREMTCDASLEGEFVSFTMTSFDIHGNESQPSTSFDLQVPSNWPPAADQAVEQMSEDGQLSGFLSASDPDGDALVYSIVGEPALGTVLLEDNTIGQYSYVPISNENGADSFTFMVTDTEGQTAEASVLITINAENDSPVAVLDFTLTTSGVAVEVDLVANDSDPDNDILAVSRIGTPLHGSATLAGTILTYQSDSEFSGIDYLSYDVVDGNGGLSTAYLGVNVQPANWIPKANDFTVETKEGSEFAGTLNGSDFDGDALTYAIVSNGFLGTVSIIDPSTGEFNYIPDPGVSGVDMFTYQVSDGQEISQAATVTVTINPDSILPDGMIFEAGEVEVDDQWLRVSFLKQFVDPVVVAFPVTMNDDDPGVVQLRNIDETGFEVHFREWEYLDGIHEIETIHYLVMEKGSYVLNDGTQVEAGRLESNGGQWFSKYHFEESFSGAPVVVTTVQTVNQEEAAVGRVKSIDGNKFKYKLQNEEGASWEHTPETIGYIAWQASEGVYEDLTLEVKRTGDVITHKWQAESVATHFSKTPHIVAAQQVTDGGNTAGVRCRSLLASGMELQIDEEQSLDDEIYHTTETAGYIALLFPGETE